MRSFNGVKSDSVRSNSDQLKSKPLPLKQRTSSVDTRRDFTVQTWTSLLGLVKPREYFVTVDHFSIWRRHLAWAMENGADLRQYMTQRYASNMVFMSLLLGAELNVLFNPSAVTTAMRRSLFAENVHTVEFWAGMTILVSVILTILSLISTFTAWGMVSSVSDVNAHCILRSSIGQYIAELPGRFIVTAVYSFLTWMTLFFFLLLPVGFWSILLVVITFSLFIHVVTVFSAFGRIIMHTGAMGSERIFDEATEKRLLPHSLHTSLYEKAKQELGRETSITRQYRRKRNDDSPADDHDGEAALSFATQPRQRADSTVRFADILWTCIPSKDTAQTPLSDISSHHDGAETPCSQASLASSEKVELQKRPLLPAPVRTSQSEATFMDPLAGSSRRLEEWLKAGPTSRDSPKNSNQRPKITPTKSPIGKGQGENRPEPFLPVPSMIPMNRAMSDNSSLDEGRELTEEEKFDLEYGELTDCEPSQVQQNIPERHAREFLYDHNDLEAGEQNSEQQHLLPDGALQASNYSSVGTSNGDDTLRKNR